MVASRGVVSVQARPLRVDAVSAVDWRRRLLPAFRTNCPPAPEVPLLIAVGDHSQVHTAGMRVGSRFNVDVSSGDVIASP
jgi:hypothetical protein